MNKVNRLANILIAFVLSACILYFAAPFLIPLSIASILAMLFVGFSDLLERKSIIRSLSSLCAVLSFLVCVILLFLLITWQIGSIADNFEDIKERLTSMVTYLLEWITDKTGISLQPDNATQSEGTNAPPEATNLIMGFANWLAGFAVNAVLVLAYMYLMLYYRSHLKKFMLKVIGKADKKNVEEIIGKSVDVAQHYLLGMFNMIALLWIMYSIGFSIVGVEGAILFAILCGLLEIVPFIGNLVGNIIVIITVLVQGGDGRMVISVIIVYMVVQFLQTYLLEPLVVGEKVNINPLFTILGLVAGQLFWGVAGMVLAMPILGIIKIICDNVPQLNAYGFLIGTTKQKSDTSPFIEKFKKFLKR